MLSQHSPLCVLLLLTWTSCTHRQTDRHMHIYILSGLFGQSPGQLALSFSAVYSNQHIPFCRHTRRCFWQHGLGWGNAYILSPDGAHTHGVTILFPSHSNQHILALERTASPLFGSVCCTVPLCQLFYPPHQHRLSTVITATPPPTPHFPPSPLPSVLLRLDGNLSTTMNA